MSGAAKSGRGEEVPCPFGEGQSETTDESRAEIADWWARLSVRERRQLATLTDPRAESCAYQSAARRDGSSTWYGLPVRVKGVFVDPPRDAEKDGEGGDNAFPVNLYEYLVAHEIVMISERVYHVCTSHAAARAALRTGHLPAGFTCPLGRPDCPMRALLALGAGRALRFEAREPKIASQTAT